MKICGKIWKMLIYNICICMHFFFQLFWNSQTLPELKLRLKYSKLYFSTSWHLKWKWMVRPCWMYLYMLTSKNHPLIFIENHTSIPEAWTLPHWSPNHPMRFVLLWKPWIYLPSIAFTNRLSSRSVLYLLLHVKSVSRIGGILISPPPICNSSILLMKMLSAFHRLHARALLPLR